MPSKGKKKLWGGRFAKGTDQAVEAFTESVSTDARMAAEDIWGSQAHALMLARQGIITQDDLREILRWLNKAQADLEAGKLQLRAELEDVHMNIETYLIEGAGPELGGKLHTARSRNDQVITDTRMRTRVEILATERAVVEVARTLLKIAGLHADALTPGFSHLQHAQPVTVGFWASGYVSMLLRDLERLREAYRRTNLCPLGACALAGTSFPTDRRLTAKLLGFDDVLEHALDCVSSRDFAVETIAALAALISTISRLAEELVLWTTHEFALVEMDDAYATGSSIMPQKKNSCVAELVRARSGRVYGALMQMLTILEAQPMGYNRAFQEDRMALWQAFDGARPAVEIMNGMLSTLTFNEERMAAQAGTEFAAATELANFLVRERGMAFRQSHEIIGKLVGTLVAKKLTFDDLEAVKKLLSTLGVAIPRDTLRALLDPQHIVAGYQSLGSTSPSEVRRMVAALSARLFDYEVDLIGREQRLTDARATTKAQVARALTAKKRASK